MRYLPILLALVAFNAPADTGTAMLPAGVEYDPGVPAPETVLGFEVGAQPVRHDQLVAYFRELAEASDRVRLEEIGRTHENRLQVMAVISSPANLARLDDIRERHLAVAAGEAEPGDGPAIIWQGYSIHGDENSGSNASMLYAYHLAAAQDERTRRSLDEVVVLLDPSLNPDGLGRYAAWATERMSQNPVTDPNHREHHQAWPGGRTNHYWFDLNRDWLLLQHPESRNRVAQLNRWRPHVVTDHHEMGSDATYFFQPGVPERTHPLTPGRNQELTGAIAEYHARRLDEAGQLYYSEESFDDFYYGKGSTYPDINGGIGILFEQAGSEGQGIETPFGERRLADSVANQLATSFSTLEAAHELGGELRRYQAGFFEDARERADDAGSAAWVIGDGGNPVARNGGSAHRPWHRSPPPGRDRGSRRPHVPAKSGFPGAPGPAAAPAHRGAVRAAHRVPQQHLLRRLRLDPAAGLRPAPRAAALDARRRRADPGPRAPESGFQPRSGGGGLRVRLGIGRRPAGPAGPPGSRG